ncbi:EF-hand calcium-binding domain-containing protein 4B [Tiliqua scincoides]|uniref:EF-hand calcium-binding domain-containing protein 4B n=1 Tax=Tiliqua scincoides TaxID=71010 RepID=UPI0034620B20
MKADKRKKGHALHGTQERGPAAGEEDSEVQLEMLKKAQEFFQLCDVEGRGFIARHDMQRLHGELPLSLEELERVFDTLDADGNGSLTPEEFTTGFSQFLFGKKSSVSETQEGGANSACPSSWKGSDGKGDVDEEEDEDSQFSTFMERLGAGKVLEDESDVKKLWSQLRKDEPQLLSNLEEFLARVFSQLQEADNEKNELECALRKKIAAYDEEIQHLYEEMEQQIKNEKEKFLLKDTERFQSWNQDLERKLVAKEQELEQLAQKQKNLEGQYKELHNDKQETKVENAQLKLTNQELHKELERTSQELHLAQQQLQMLQDEAKMLQEEKEIEVYRVTETLQREKSGLLKQLDFLRERNKYLRDERDICLQKTRSVPGASWKQRSGSIIGKYVEAKGPLKSQSSEDDDPLNSSRRRNSLGWNGLDSDSAAGAGLTPKKRLQRIISIEEDHLPQLLDRPGDGQLSRCSEEDESVSPEMEHHETQIASLSEKTPSSPRGQPVGKETLANREESLHFAPDRLFKIVLVGNSSVGKTSFLRQFCENRFSPSTAATVGVDYSVKTVPVENSQVALQLWDTAGQERYHSITKQFFRKADGIIVMYDITARDTFTAVKHWLVSIEEATGENIPVLLLGNKTDNEHEREVPKGLGEHLAKDYSLTFYECSALSGHNTSESVLHLARILKEQEDKVKEKTIQLHQDSKKKACCSRQ